MLIVRIIHGTMLALVLAGCQRTSVKTPPTDDSATIPETISFPRDVLPILSDNCFPCHGPDESNRKPKITPLRIDRSQDVFALRQNGDPVIIKGDPDASKFYQLISSPDPDEIMPPPRSHKFLKHSQIAILKRWIEQGAPYCDPPPHSPTNTSTP